MIEQNIHDRDFCYAYSDELPDEQAEVLRAIAKNAELAIVYDTRLIDPSLWDLFLWGKNYEKMVAFRFFFSSNEFVESTLNDNGYVATVLNSVQFPCKRASFKTLEDLLKYAKEFVNG